MIRGQHEHHRIRIARHDLQCRQANARRRVPPAGFDEDLPRGKLGQLPRGLLGMWTEANLDGKWVPLDATLGRGGIGATHIKLGDATFADEAAAPLSTFANLLTVIGKLKIEVVSVK